MVNRVLLMGRLVKDPELRKTNSDVSFATFTLAVDNRVREADGTRGTIFIDCRVFREQAESLVKNTRKGSRIAVDGSLNQRNFERRDGTKGHVIEIVVDSITFLDPNPNREQNTVEEPKFDDIQVPPSNNLDSIDLPDDDLPF